MSDAFSAQSLERKPRRVKFLLGLLIVGLLILVFVGEAKRRAVERELQAVTIRLQEIQGPNTSSEEAEAARRDILEKVQRHVVLPEGSEPLVATIVDIEQLIKQNEFYRNGKNGDYVIVTEKFALLYDPDLDKVKEWAPVQIQEATGQQKTSSTR